MGNNKYPLFSRNPNGTGRVLGTPKLDSFGNNREHPLDAVLPASPDIVERIKNTYQDPVPVIFPRVSSAPEGSRTIDLRKVISVPAAATLPLYQFECRPGSTTVFYGYSLFTDAVGFPDLVWTPLLDGNRILPFHGDPSVNTNPLNMSTSFGGSTPELVSCQILMQPKQVLSWTVTNNTGAPVNMGVRSIGYVDMSQRLVSSKFGD